MMKTDDLQNELNKLSKRERDILKEGISYHAAVVLLRLFPNNAIIKELVEQKAY